MAQVINNLSHLLSFTLHQRAVDSTPPQPTKFFNILRILPLDSVKVVPSRGATFFNLRVQHVYKPLFPVWCWWYRKSAPGDTVLEGLESEAREAKKGLWGDPQPAPPWEWRKRHRQSTPCELL
jgi:hypothetical protein